MGDVGDKRARWSDTTFLVCFGATLALLLWISRGFLVPLLLGLSAAVLLNGLNEKLVRALGGRRGIAALLMSVATFLVILVPLAILGVLLVQSAVPLAGRITQTLQGTTYHDVIARLPANLQELVARLDLDAIEASIRSHLGGIAAGLGAFAASIPGRAANVLLDGFITFLALYTFFVQGPKMVETLIDATPMERRYTRRLFDAVALGIQSVFAASFITALIQLALGYVGFRIVQAPYPLALAGVMAFFSFIFSLVPVLGSGMVWGPLGVWMLFTGRPIAGIFVILWGILVLGSVDNVVKPLYTKGKLQLPPLIVFVTLFGGIAVLGPIGALVGPLVAGVGGAFLRIWTTEFLGDGEPEPKVEGEAGAAPPKRPLLARLRPRKST